jgi:hypothetical protein
VRQKPVPVLSFQRGHRHRPGNGTGLEGLNDVHRMGLVEGLHHLDAKALVCAEKHRVVDGASGSAHLLGSHAGPRMPATWGVIGSGSTALGWTTAVRYAKRGMLRLGQEQRPQLLWVQSLVIARSTDVDHSNSPPVYRAGQVVCRPVNHS